MSIIENKPNGGNEQNNEILANLSSNPEIFDLMRTVDKYGDFDIEEVANADDADHNVSNNRYLKDIYKYKVSDGLTLKSSSEFKNLKSLPMTLKFMIPAYKQEVITVNRFNDEYISRLLDRKDVREKVINCVGNYSLIFKLFSTFIHTSNSNVYLNNTVTSFSAIKDAVSSVLNTVVGSDEHLVLTSIISRYIDFYGLILHEPEIDTIVTLSNGEDPKTKLTDMLMANYAKDAVGSLPSNGTIKSNRTTINELSLEFIQLHSNFRGRLLDFGLFADAVDRVLYRMRSILTVSTSKDFGDQSVMLPSSQMDELMTYADLVNNALTKRYREDVVMSPAYMWRAEEDRVLAGITNLIDMKYIRVVSRLEFVKMYDMQVIRAAHDEEYASKRVVVISPKIDSVIDHKLYRAYSYDSSSIKSLVEDNRLPDLNAFQQSLRSLKFTDMIVKNIKYTITPFGDRFLVLDSIDHDTVRLLSMALADQLVIDTESPSDIYYGYKVKSEDIREGIVTISMQDLGLSDNPYFVIFNKISDDSKATVPLRVYGENIKFKPGRLMLLGNLKSSKVKEGRYGKILSRVDLESDIQVKVNINNKDIGVSYKLFDYILDKTSATYLMTKDDYTSKKVSDFIYNLDLVVSQIFSKTNGTKRRLDQNSLFYITLIETIKPIVQSAVSYEAVAYNILWNHAQKHNLSRSLLIDDVLFVASVRIMSMIIMGQLLGVDLAPIWNVMEHRRLEFARELNLIKDVR